MSECLKSRVVTSGTLIQVDSNDSTLALFVEWVYTDSVPEITAINLNEAFRQLIDLYLLAQKLCTDPCLGNLVMNRIRQHCRQGVADISFQSTIREYYEKGEAKSPLRRWLVKSVAWNLVNKKHDVGDYKSLIEKVGPFAMDLILALMSAASAPFPNPLEEPDCKYHKHAEDVECAA